jgi:hypothetical protein
MQFTVLIKHDDVVFTLTVRTDAGREEKLAIRAEGESARVRNHTGGQYGLRGAVEIGGNAAIVRALRSPT